TRFSRDWSSDVCSSDLAGDADEPGRGGVGGDRRRGPGPTPRGRGAVAAGSPGRPGGPGRALARVPRLPARRAAGAGRLPQRGAAVTTVVIGASGLTRADVLAVARHGARVALDPAAVAAMAASRAIVEKIERDQRPVYRSEERRGGGGQKAERA